jgi:hypothetical protein
VKNKLYVVGLCAAVAFAFGCKKKEEKPKPKPKPEPTAPKTVAPKTKTPPAAATGASHKGKVQLTFVFTAKPDQVAEGDKLFASHAAWMATSHQKDGKLALLRYNVVKGAVLSEALNPGSKPTKDTHFVLTEVYETADGIADHWKKAAAKDGWKDFKAFVGWASKTKITDLHGGAVIQSLWDKASPNHKGKTQLTLVFTTKAADVAEGEKLFATTRTASSPCIGTTWPRAR